MTGPEPALPPLLAVPWRDSARAERLLQALAARAGGPPEAEALLEALAAALPDSPDSDLALGNLERWTSHLATPRSTLSLLRDDPRLLADLTCLLGASQYLADVLARDPAHYALFLEPDAPRTPEQYAAQVEAALRPLRRPEGRRDALRRVKRREFLRIGWRDLCRRAPLPEVAREISDLADALIAGALRLAREEVDPRFPTAAAAVRFTILAMGKLGARELNYSSDVDLMFVMDSPSPHDEAHRRYATRLAERLVALLAEDTEEGRCFRVDMRLRPEGRSGALVRTLAGYRAYYDRWVETWERQALIKVRPVAGDETLGAQFLELARPVTYRRIQGAALLEDVREMRALVERKLAAAGETEQHVKEGRGTLRDVEFTVQLLQLLFGADRPSLQVADTWTALTRLASDGLLTPDEERTFREGYRFFREVEHRLQLFQDLPVRLVPAGGPELDRLARSLGFQDGASFQAAYRSHRGRVRAVAEGIQARLGVQAAPGDGGLREAVLSADTPPGGAELRRLLEERGFPEPDRARDALIQLATGAPKLSHPSGVRRLFADLAPQVLEAAAAAPDPTLALEGLAGYADRKLLHRALYQSLQERPEDLRALCTVAGGAPAAMRTLLRYPELSEIIVDPDISGHIRTYPEICEDLNNRLASAPTHERRLSVLRRFRLREQVRLAARHVLAPVPPEQETAEWSDVADATLQAALDTALRRLTEQGRWSADGPAGFAVLALGRYGGRDLHFPSDLDLLYVYDPAAGLGQQPYESLARALGEVLQTTTEDGKLWDLDLRLRPEGRQGFTVASLEAVRRYYGEGGRAQTWELQMLTRLRFVAGSAATAAELVSLVEPRVYRHPMPPEWRDEIRTMKLRMEAERVGDAERPRHLKLGPGGLADLEFVVQYLQLAHGAADPAVRTPSLLGAIQVLKAGGHLAPDEAAALVEGYRLLTRLRQSLSLLRLDGPSDALPGPESPRLAETLARAAGFETPGALDAAHAACTARVRELFHRSFTS